jgi:hypothetical protein
MGQAKEQYIEWLESQITDEDWAEYEVFLDEQEAEWWKKHEQLPPAQEIDYEAELDDLREQMADVEFWRRGTW